jgi:hypothetical protein
MATYAINYDLKKPGQNYQPLYDAIKKYGTHWHCMDSFWIVKTSDSASQVHANLHSHIDANDALMVSQMGPEAAWSGLPDAGTPWLKDKLKAA